MDTGTEFWTLDCPACIMQARRKLCGEHGEPDSAVNGAAMTDWINRNALEVLWQVALGAVWIAIAMYVVVRLRGTLVKDGSAASSIVNNFRDLHAQGELTDEEYRTIRTMLAAKARRELSDTGDKG